MKVEEVINAALAYLGENDYDAGKDKAQDDKIKLLERCVNIMLTEIAQEYLPLVDECEVVAENNKFSYEEIPRRVSRIVSVKDKDGNKISFRQRSFSSRQLLRLLLLHHFVNLSLQIHLGGSNPAAATRPLLSARFAPLCHN